MAEQKLRKLDLPVEAIKKIQSLTPAQEARMEEYRDKWIEIARRTGPLELPQTLRALALAYDAAELPACEDFYIFPSIVSAAYGTHIISDILLPECNDIGKQLIAAWPGFVPPALQDHMWAARYVLESDRMDPRIPERPEFWGKRVKTLFELHADAIHDLLDQVSNRVAIGALEEIPKPILLEGMTLGPSLPQQEVIAAAKPVFEALPAAVRDAAREFVSRMQSYVIERLKKVKDGYWLTETKDLRRATEPALQNQIFGAHDTGWMAFYDYFYGAVGVEECVHLEGLMQMSQYCGWWGPCYKTAFLQHRCAEFHHDDTNVLHNENGPALQYLDGNGFYMMNDIFLPENVIMDPGSQTLEEIRTETNIEAKRIRIERFGWQRYLEEAGARVLVPATRNDMENTYETLVRTTEDDRQHTLLVATCKTGRWFAMEVPDGITTLEEARNYLPGRDEVLSELPPLRSIGRS